MIRSAITLTAVFALVGCAGSAKQVQVKGQDSQIVTLAGQWTGNYKGIDSGREGTIEFKLTVGRHTAEGEVLMYPAGVASQTAPSPLSIQFVKVDGDRVSGKVGPYMDPSCSCEVETEFLGDLDGDLIDGTFVTRIAANNTQQTGLWSVERGD